MDNKLEIKKNEIINDYNNKIKANEVELDKKLKINENNLNKELRIRKKI